MDRQCSLLGHQERWFVLKNSLQLGFTLIELLVALAIFGILMAVGIPSFSAWTQNSQIRTAAGAIQNGLQLARAEAVRRNTLIRFQLTDTIDSGCALSTSDTNWVVSFDDPTGSCNLPLLDDSASVGTAAAPRMIQIRPATEGSNRVVAVANQSTVIFNGLGRLSAVAPAVAPFAFSVELKPSTGSARNLKVNVSLGGQIRLCDDNLPAGDPQKC